MEGCRTWGKVRYLARCGMTPKWGLVWGGPKSVIFAL